MRLEIENIGMISKAEIDLKKISVIAGENDTGKSTVGKVLYSIVHGVNASPEAYKDVIKKNIQSVLEVIKKKLYNNIPDDERNYAEKEIFEMIKNGTFVSKKEEEQKKINEVINDFTSIMNSIFARFSILEDEKEFDRNFNKHFKLLEDGLKKFDNSEMMNEGLKMLKSFGNLKSEDGFIEKTGINAALSLEFKEQIKSIFTEEIGKIKFFYGKNKILDFDIIDNKINRWNSKPKNIYSKDVTYIESPFIFSILNAEDRDKRILKKLRGDIELYNHTDNLLEKLNSLKKDKYTKLFINEIENKIFENINLEKTLEKCMNGKMKYSEDDEDFVLIKNKQKIDIQNVATGIKSFGLVSLVLEGGYLKDDNILILDEPEVHLHPKWQIEYAKLIAELAKNLNIRILITSHSPYFIEAIEKYSRKFGLADETNFYLSQKSEDGNSAVIENVNNDIEKIFNTLADAYDNLDEDIIGDM